MGIYYFKISNLTLSLKCPYYLLLYIQHCLIIHCFIRNVQTAARNERVAEIKKLNGEINGETEAAKCEEKLEECNKYQLFLLECTPEDWYADRQAELKAERAEAIRASPPASYLDYAWFLALRRF